MRQLGVADGGGLGLQAAAAARAGRHEEAVALWERLNHIVPGHAGIAAGLGAALLGAGRREDARAWLGAACGRHPGDALLLRLHAQALLRCGDRGPAIGALYMALALEPESALIHADLGSALYLDRSSALALPHAEIAFAADPSDAGSAATLGSVLLDLGRAEQALAVVERALLAGANRSTMMVLRSLAMNALDRGEASLRAARDAVESAPDNAIARHNLAGTLLLHGEMTAEAWDLYDARAGLLEMRTWPGQERRWTGGDVRGRTVLLHAEQGLGDTLQFVRYVPLVAARGAKVVLAVQSALVRLLQGTPGAEFVVAGGPDLPAFDLYCPLLSLPGVFGTTLEAIPPPLAYGIPFERSAPRSELQVGLVWAGNRDFLDDRGRSIDPELLAPLAKVGGIALHSLQFGASASAAPLPGLIDAMEGVRDFADTAARIAGLDLVIAVDTSVAHLAATMGKPVWLLSRFPGCWRWMLRRDDTPWYPTMRLYRQQRPGEWSEVIARVRDDLAQVASGQAIRPLAA